MPYLTERATQWTGMERQPNASVLVHPSTKEDANT
jgi:hypothetical protein